MKELKRLFRRLLPHLPRILLCIGFLYFAPALIESITAQRPPPHVFVYLGPLVFILGIAGLALRVHWENRFLGDGRRQPFRMEPGEALLFSSFYSGGALLYLRAGDYSPRARIRHVASGEKRLLGDRSLRVWLTDRRLMLQSQSGNTWRIIPISSIGRVTEAPRRFFFSPDRVVIVYHHEGRSEVLVIEDKSLMGRTLKEALLALNLFTAGPSGPLSAGLPSKIAGS
jgi:hypothetical protein